MWRSCERCACSALAASSIVCSMRHERRLQRSSRGILVILEMQCNGMQGNAMQGKAMQCKARQGKARQGKARQGKARQGKARQSEEVDCEMCVRVKG